MTASFPAPWSSTATSSNGDSIRRARIAVPHVTSHGHTVIVVCNEGYASSLAAATLQRLGLRNATDLVGGIQAWIAAGLPIDPSPG